ncbi:Flp family type IVb pilin [Spirillospora sp. CA-142024]|jgi:Flp pilus assembly pilin Flp|uniref:Flp family type IVb pilin n=1 Tax=unclassified Spirillospora TaxID=2642701 RepID=UPI003D8D507B
MNPLNPLNDPAIVYLRAMVGARLARLRSDEERSRGASAIEWAIITAILALIAITIGAVIQKKIQDKANSINTG